MNGRVLAGGLSSRFGSDKALYCLDGEPMAVRTARILTEAGLSSVALVVRAPRGLGPLGEEGGGDHVAIGGGVVGGGDEPARRNSTRTIAAERTRLKAPSAMPAVP